MNAQKEVWAGRSRRAPAHGQPMVLAGQSVGAEGQAAVWAVMVARVCLVVQ